MVDTRESLGEFESSIFDASDGHKLVDLIRRKKGIHVQTQKIFDDVPSQRPSLQIEIQRLDQENESLQSENLPQEPAPASKAVVNSEVQPNIEFVPKSPVRTSVGRSITSPIIKMSSTTLGRRTLLKEFEKAFLHESRFLPEICSTPISSDFANEINHRQNDLVKESRSSEKESPEENIVCTPITISDEGSPAEPTSNTDNQLHMINRNELLNALVQQSQEEPDATLVNRDDLLTKSPRRTYTVERDISSGKIILSPAKNTESDPKKFTRKLNATPEQRKLLFNKLGLELRKGISTENGKESPQKSSRIPVFSKATTANVPQSLPNQESTTADFVERLQKNATPNCPVIVIPVNQTFNQAPNNRTITNNIPHIDSPPLNEITSTMSDNIPKETEKTHKQPNRVDSPVSNVISSTTFSKGEQQQKGKMPEPPTNNLRWDDIITDDASSSNNNSDCSTRRSPLKYERKKLSKKKQSHKQQSATHEKNKLSLSYQCLDLRLRVDSDEDGEHNLPPKSQRAASKIGEQRRPENANNSPRKSRQEFSRIRDQCEEDREQNLRQRSQERDSKANDQYYGERENNLQRRGASKIKENLDQDSEHRSRRGASRIAEQCDKEPEKTLPYRSRQEASKVDEQCCVEPGTHLQQRSRRAASKIDENCEHDFPQRSRRGASKISEQSDQERERDLNHRSHREASKIHDHCYEDRSRQGSSTVDEQCNKDYNHDLAQRSQRGASRIAEHSDEERQQTSYERSPPVSSENDKRGGKQRENILSQRSRASRITEQYDEEREQILPHRSRQEASKYREQSNGEREKSLTRGGPMETDEQSDEEREQVIPHRSRRETSKQRQEEFVKKLSHRVRGESSENSKQRGKDGEDNLHLPSRRGTSNIVEQPNEEHEHNLPRRCLMRDCVSDNPCGEDREHNLPQRSEREPSVTDDDQRNKQCDNLPRRTRAKTYNIDKQREANFTKERENNLQPQSQQKTTTIVEQGHEEIESNIPRRSQENISKIDQQISQLRHTIQGNNDEFESFQELPPPDEFRDIDSNSQRRSNSISLQKDLVDEISSDRILMDVFKRPSEVNSKKKRKPKIIPENVKKYLEVNQTLARTQYLNVSKRKLYSKGNSDLDTSDDSCFSIKANKENSISKPQKFPRQSRKSAKSSKSLTSRNVDNKTEKLSKPEPVNNSHHKKPLVSPLSKAIDIEVNHKKMNQMNLSRSRRRAISSPSSSDQSSSGKDDSDRVNNNNQNESNVDKNISVRSSRSNVRTSNTAKNSRKRNKSAPKGINKDVESNLENDIIEPELTTRSELFLRRSNNSSPTKTSKQSNQLSSRKSHRDVDSNLEDNSSGRSSRSRSTARVSKNPGKTNKSKTKDINKDVESNLEEEVSVTPKSHKSKKTASSQSKAKKALEQDNRPLTSIVNEDVEENTENIPAAAPSKPRSKKKVTKKIIEDLTSNASSVMENPDCGPRRSRREKKQPTAYWACSNSQYTHVYDIYNMLTKGRKPYFPEYLMNPKLKKKDKKKLPSTDDNLVANTNSVDSSSKKNTNEAKRQSKNKNKKGSKANGEIQSDSENQSRRPNVVPSECPPESSELAEIQEQASTVPSVDKTSSQVISKSKKKTKGKLSIKDLAKANHAEQDTNSNIQTSTSSSSSVSSTDPYTTDNFLQPRSHSMAKPLLQTDPSSSDCRSEDEVTSNVQNRRLTTIAEDAQMVFNNRRTSNTLMPPPKTNVVKKVNKISKKNAFHTEHDESIADVSSVHVNNLFDQLKNSSINNTSRIAANSSGQVSLDNRSSSSKKRNTSNSAGKAKNVSVRLQRLNLHNEGPYDTNDRNFDSGFSSEEMVLRSGLVLSLTVRK